MRWFSRIAALAALSAGLTLTAHAQTTLLNVSYDVSREVYQELNPVFQAEWQKTNGQPITVKQSHGGSSKQALAVLNGLEADVVTMNQPTDIDILVERGGLVAKDWAQKFPNGASPYSTAIVFVVRKGNPKGIKDWDDLARKGIEVLIPNPKTSGNGRYTYLSAYGYALKKPDATPQTAERFLSNVFANVPVLDGGGRGATTTFTQNGIGDVLVTFENEALALAQEVGAGKFDIVYPSLSVEAAPPVAVVDTVVKRKGTEKAAQAYLSFLYTPAAQEIIAKRGFRPRDEAVSAKHRDRFPTIATFKVEDVFGGWAKAQQDHFSDGGSYDRIIAAKG
jgi:sulfate transport system substrate-binding protein